SSDLPTSVAAGQAAARSSGSVDRQPGAADHPVIVQIVECIGAATTAPPFFPALLPVHAPARLRSKGIICRFARQILPMLGNFCRPTAPTLAALRQRLFPPAKKTMFKQN